ncbi:hypothetical protein CKO11_16630 [Rhodobacter sp. TJ_12]|uniref:hypothetical protein n=1 Tax=Rhodobacter sp. TJ_12 TaxID=2029399 RepID=UPI001CBDF430|nr:hypothetical protein [Rhodobacter sp. TJ_12]MBZ4024075.1 hypothetical protein [Rhodobacter sp. TJ_12]
MKPKRDNDYFLKRLKDEHPQIYTDYLAGKFKNPTEAFKVAGLVKSKTPLQKLENAWKDASDAERAAFKAMIGCTTPAGAPTAPSVPGVGLMAGSPSLPPATRPVSPVAHLGSEGVSAVVAPTAHIGLPRHLQPGRGQLTASEEADVREIMDRRKIKIGGIMKEIGMNPLDASLGYALRRKTSLSADLLDRLRPWIAKHRKP